MKHGAAPATAQSGPELMTALTQHEWAPFPMRPHRVPPHLGKPLLGSMQSSSQHAMPFLVSAWIPGNPLLQVVAVPLNRETGRRYFEERRLRSWNHIPYPHTVGARI